MKLKRHFVGLIEKRDVNTGAVIDRKEVYVDFFQESLFKKLIKNFDFWWDFIFLNANLMLLFFAKEKYVIIFVTLVCASFFNRLYQTIIKINEERKIPDQQHMQETFQKEMKKFYE